MYKNLSAAFLVLFLVGCQGGGSSGDAVLVIPPAPTPLNPPEPLVPKKNLVYIESDREFERIEQNVVLYFFATWCGPCQQQAPIYEELAKENPTIMFYKIDVDKCRGAARKKGVTSIPRIFVYKQSFIGVQSKETLQRAINEQFKR